MKTICNDKYRLPFETVYAVYSCVNDVSYNALYERMCANCQGYINDSLIESFYHEFNRLEQIRKSICELIDINKPEVKLFFRHISLTERETFSLAHFCFEKLCAYSCVTLRECINSMKENWNRYQREGYSFSMNRYALDIESAELSTDPNYLIEQMSTLPYEKEICFGIYLFFLNFDSRIEELYLLLEPCYELICKTLAVENSVRDSVIETWRCYLDCVCGEDFFAAIYEDATRRPEEPISVFFTSMRPNQLLREWRLSATPGIYQYCAEIGLGILPNYVNDTFYKDPVKLRELLRLLCDKPKFDILCKLKSRPYYNQELANELGIHEGNMSRNMAALFNAGFVVQRRENGKRMYYINDEAIDRVLNGVHKMLCH